MTDEKNTGNDGEEKRSYFRVDDIISVVVTPVPVDKKESEEFRNAAGSSKAFSLMDIPGSSEPDTEEMPLENEENSRMYSMMSEIKTKLDFIINHIMLEKEGLLTPEKKLVNISASGIKVTMDHPVEVNDIMEIKLLLPTYPPVAVFAYGEVKRVKKLNEESYEVAFEYMNMGDSVKNEIIQYTLSHQRERIRKMKELVPNE